MLSSARVSFTGRGKQCLWWQAIIPLLWIILLIRVHHILALPVFNDESLHIRRAEVVWSFSDTATSFTAGKLLDYYWLGLFGFDRMHALIGGRLVHALFILIGAAAAYRVGRDLFGHGAGLLALILYACAPPLIFYERLILADQIAASLGMVAVWRCLRLGRDPTQRNGKLCGVFLSLAILGKTTAAPLALLPILTSGLQNREHRKESTRRRGLIACYGVCAVCGLPFILFPIAREIQREPVLLIGGNLFASSGLDRLWITNLGRLWEAGTAYFGTGAVLVGVALIGRLVIWRRSEALFLLAAVLLPWSVLIVFGVHPSNRYWLPGLIPLIVLVAGELWDMGRQSWARRMVIGGAVGLWAVLIVGPLICAAWDDPLKLRVPERDRWEYFTNTSSGYGITEAARFLPTLARSPISGRVPVASTTVECHALRLFLAEDGAVDLTCPFFGWKGEHMDAVIAHIGGRLAAEGMLYLLIEPDAPFADIDLIRQQWGLIPVATFPRPWDGVAVELVQVIELPQN